MIGAQSEGIDADQTVSEFIVNQQDFLLTTKLLTPPVQPKWMRRSRLFDLLNRGSEKPLTLVSASAGYGKTTLISSWLNESDIPSAWLSLDEDDNDPIRFLQYFLSALQRIIPTIKPDLIGVIKDFQPGSLKILVNILINEITRNGIPFVLVLDDFQLIQAKTILEIIAHFLEHLPPNAHLAILTRSDPLLPISRLRARNQLIEIRADQLRFTQAEIACFLNQALELKLSAAEIDALEGRTEGWIAGLQLAAIALRESTMQSDRPAQESGEIRGFLTALTSSHYYIIDYLAEEVLKLQAEPIRTFLLQTSILDRMCGSLCDFLVGMDRSKSISGQAVLETLEQMNLFIIPLDHQRRWYRYHHLFAEVLKRFLEQSHSDLIPELHRRASLWYEQNGFVFDAIRHALMMHDKNRAAQLVDKNGCQLLIRGEVVNLLSWIQAVEPYSQSLPWIAIQKGWALCMTGHPERAEEPLNTAEQLISVLEMTDDVKTMAGATTAARAYRSEMLNQPHEASMYARQALDYLPVSTDFSCSLRSAATSILGDASRLEGNLKAAQSAYEDAVLISRAAGNIHMEIITSTNLAELLFEQGRLNQALKVFSEALRMVSLPEGKISPLAGRVFAGMARLAYEWNHLEEAAKSSKQCWDLSVQLQNTDDQAISAVLLAKLNDRPPHSETTLDDLRTAEQLVNQASLPPWWSIFVKSSLAKIWISRGDLSRSSSIAGVHQSPNDENPEHGENLYSQEYEATLELRLHLIQKNYDAGLLMSDQILKRLDGSDRLGCIIEAMILRALAYQGKKDLGNALTSLERALTLARPEGFVRTFIDEGEPLAKLLYQAKSQHIEPAYVDELLAALGETFDNELPPANLLIDPLTRRELEILKLIETGSSNQEIASSLVISLATVKRHISNIYSKLGAGSRTQAISRARELQII